MSNWRWNNAFHLLNKLGNKSQFTNGNHLCFSWSFVFLYNISSFFVALYIFSEVNHEEQHNYTCIVTVFTASCSFPIICFLSLKVCMTFELWKSLLPGMGKLKTYSVLRSCTGLSRSGQNSILPYSEKQTLQLFSN